MEIEIVMSSLLFKILNALDGWKRIVGIVIGWITAALVSFCGGWEYCGQVPVDALTEVLYWIANVLMAWGAAAGVLKNLRAKKEA